jgi:hypothetical protein
MVKPTEVHLDTCNPHTHVYEYAALPGFDSRAINALGALLAGELPPFGGDTLFANMDLACEALSAGMKRLLAGLRAVNSSARADVSRTREDRVRSDGRAGARAEYTSEHPVVRTHPDHPGRRHAPLTGPPRRSVKRRLAGA